MAKSKLVKGSRRIAEHVTDRFQKMSGSVVSGFNKMSDGVVRGYTRIENGFTDWFLTRDGESVEEAKQRLRREIAGRTEDED